MENLGFTLLNGGFHLCNPDWDKKMDKLDQCYKLYFPVAGSAELVIDDNTYHIRAGNIYFISGFHINEQSCRDFMNIYWVHFVPKSVKIGIMLSQAPPVYNWNSEEMIWAENTFKRIDKIFRDSPLPAKQTPLESSIPLVMKIEGLIIHLIGDLFEKVKITEADIDPLSYARMEASIKYMDSKYLDNPSLEKIAKLSFLAPNYFHRLFSETFGMSPFLYMLKRKMDLAKKLLSSSGMTVKEISAACGYGNEFHFSRSFSKHFGISPSRYRGRAGRG